MPNIDRLWPDGPHFYYDPARFPPSTDSFALGWFTRVKAGETVCDLGCGAGLLGVLLLAREASLRYCGVELDAEALALATRTFRENGWDAALCAGDLRDPAALPAAGSADCVVCNPPYFPAGSGESAASPARRSAREECACTLDDVCTAAARVLRWGGRFTLVHRPERLTDLLCTLRAHALEPKRLRFLCKAAEAAPSLVLLEARRGGGRGLRVEPPLIPGSPEWDGVYFR